MDPKRDDSDTSEIEELLPLNEAEAEEREEEEEEEEEEEDEEEDAKIFNAWMLLYRAGEQQKKLGDEEDVKEMPEEDEEEEKEEKVRPASRCSFEPPPRMKIDRRASLPCPATLSSMQLSRLHSASGAPVTARVLLRRSSSRRLLPSPQESPSPVATIKPALERRPSLIPTIPEAVPPERRSQFRRRNVMSLSDAYCVCLICHNDLNQGSGTRELECTHTFHKECIEEWLWRKHSCPTCRVQVSVQPPIYDCVKVP
ncbi:unnamed protein product [Ophioblennius macclurei]